MSDDTEQSSMPDMLTPLNVGISSGSCGEKYHATAMLRLPAVLERTGIKRSTLYRRIDQGTFPPAVKDGERISVWPEAEINQLNKAKIAGKKNEEIKELIGRIINERMM